MVSPESQSAATPDPTSHPGVVGVMDVPTPLPRHAPRVLVPACQRLLGQHPTHTVGRKYVDAVRLAGALPVVVPAAHADELDAWLDLADGVMLTGSPSNVHPRHFGATVLDPSLPLDPLRDQWTLPLVRKALALGMPVFGICRGFQEINVALGGSLHQAVQTLPGHLDHRVRGTDQDTPVATQYSLAHTVALTPGGVLSSALREVARRDESGAQVIEVNSLHGQGVDRLAPNLRIEATAPDSLIEAFSGPAEAGFCLAVQWHPEWMAAHNPVSRRLFAAFGAACQSWRDLHRPPGA